MGGGEGLERKVRMNMWEDLNSGDARKKKIEDTAQLSVFVRDAKGLLHIRWKDWEDNTTCG